MPKNLSVEDIKPRGFIIGVGKSIAYLGGLLWRNTTLWRSHHLWRGNTGSSYSRPTDATTFPQGEVKETKPKMDFIINATTYPQGEVKETKPKMDFIIKDL